MASDKFRMEYRLLGKTGLKVSVLGLGGMTFDTADQTVALMRCVRKYGVNFFDNAEGYGNPLRGMAETNFGKALKILEKEDKNLWRRSDLVITTKLYFGPQKGSKPTPSRQGFGVNEYGLTRKHLFEGMKDSLERMQLDYVDIVYAHRPDYLTSVEEIVRSFNFLIEKGYAFHWGTSMWKPTQIVEAYVCVFDLQIFLILTKKRHVYMDRHWIAKMYGLVGPVVEQPKYSMFDRKIMEYDYLDLFKDPYYLATTIWNVLDRGMLTGKYNKEIPKNGRLSGNNALGAFVGHQKHITKEKLEKVEKLMVIADELGVTVSQLAIAWLIKNSNVTVCMLGATKVHQLQDSMGAIKAANLINKQHIKRIEEVLQNKPKSQDLDMVFRINEKIISSL